MASAAGRSCITRENRCRKPEGTGTGPARLLYRMHAAVSSRLTCRQSTGCWSTGQNFILVLSNVVSMQGFLQCSQRNIFKAVLPCADGDVIVRNPDSCVGPEPICIGPMCKVTPANRMDKPDNLRVIRAGKDEGYRRVLRFERKTPGNSFPRWPFASGEYRTIRRISFLLS